MEIQRLGEYQSNPDAHLIFLVAEELYPLLYPNQSQDIPLWSRSEGSQLFIARLVREILESSGLLFGETDIFNIAAAIHQVTCPIEAQVKTFEDLSEWRQSVLMGWAQRVVSRIIGDDYHA